jgi:hypothetical protein
MARWTSRKDMFVLQFFERRVVSRPGAMATCHIGNLMHRSIKYRVLSPGRADPTQPQVTIKKIFSGTVAKNLWLTSD